MKIVEVIPYKFWRHKETGKRVSIGGAVPWISKAGREEWELATEGFTWRNDNGTTGLGRVPAKTREEAEEVARKFNAREWSK